MAVAAAPARPVRGEILADPLDKDRAGGFFAAYEARPRPQSAEHLKYLQLKCLHEPSPWRWLNDLGRHLADQGRRSSAFLCFIQSLWLNSRQPETFDVCESLQSAVIPPTFTGGSPVGCGVSVIMPTYNRGAAIRESLLSVLHQTWPDFEIIVVNDGGDDALEAVSRALDDPRIRHCRLERNLGKSSARNAGIRAAKGRYIAFLDDDDVYLPDHLQSLVRALADGRHKVAYAGTRGVLGRQEAASFIREEDLFVWNETFHRDRLLERIFITSCSIMVEREVLATSGLFTTGLHLAQDWDLWLRCALSYQFRHVDKVTSEYRLSSRNSTIADRTGAYLFGHLVTQYHIHFHGLMAYAKYFAEAGDMAEARRRYELVLTRRPEYFRHRLQLEDIAGLARTLGELNTARSLTREYFEGWPRECLRSTLKQGSPLSRMELFRRLPARIVRSLSHRARRILRRRT